MPPLLQHHVDVLGIPEGGENGAGDPERGAAVVIALAGLRQRERDLADALGRDHSLRR
jgi:hypothetical protein